MSSERGEMSAKLFISALPLHFIFLITLSSTQHPFAMVWHQQNPWHAISSIFLPRREALFSGDSKSSKTRIQISRMIAIHWMMMVLSRMRMLLTTRNAWNTEELHHLSHWISIMDGRCNVVKSICLSLPLSSFIGPARDEIFVNCLPWS